eukprot:jgi/Mesen1/10671/ME000009S10460
MDEIELETRRSPSPPPPAKQGREGSSSSLSDMFKSSGERARRRDEVLRSDTGIVEHTWTEERLLAYFNTDPLQGLASEQVKANKRRFGDNRLSPGARTPAWLKFLKQFTNFFALLLLAASLLCFVAYAADTNKDVSNLSMGAVLLVVVAMTATFAHFQEARSEHVMEGFRRLVPAKCHVIRDGIDYVIDAHELVSGDVVELADGDRVPADVRIIKSSNLMVDNSSLTGESEPVERGPELAHDVAGSLLTQPLEARNLCFCTTIVTSGTGRGIVILTGDRTVMGQIAGLASTVRQQASPLASEIARFVHFIAVTAISLGTVFFCVSLAMGEGFIHTLVFAIGVIVANVPEGLMATVTTGYEVTQPGFDVLSLECAGDASEQGLLKFVEPLRSAKEFRASCPKLFEIKFNPHNKWQLSIHRQEASPGGPSRQADAAAAAASAGLEEEPPQQPAPPLPPVLVMKGAPERVLACCSHILLEGRVQELLPEHLTRFHAAYERLGGYGERVLGFAYSEVSGYPPDFEFSEKGGEPNFATDDLTFVGLASLIDPPRPGVEEAVRTCKEASIKIYMVTGDHPITAKAVAKMVGIVDEEKLAHGRAVVVTGDDIRDWMSLGSPAQQNAKWDEALNHEQVVFARVSPAHKLLLVEHCQRRGEVVAVTGDGVNDAPALKRADIGIAMGVSGRDVSKEAADMILMDDNFASIVAGVEEGRLIFDNLKKTIGYALTVNVPELVPFLANVLLRIPLPLTTVLMLAICLGTDMLPAISLAYEEREADIMRRPPRTKKDPLVSGRLVAHAYLIVGVLQAFAGFLAYLAVLNDYGYVPRILVNRGLDFGSSSLICRVDANNEPTVCGYGCAKPDYARGLPSPLKYCREGCPAPLPGQVQDPFSEFDASGFRGVAYCALTCQSDPFMFPGGLLPKQCGNATLAAKIGFPGRGRIGKPHAPAGGLYWWGGRQQPRPNHRYQKEVLHYAQTAYFLAIVITQWANLFVCKTRKLSIFTQGLNNGMLNFSLVFETLLAAAMLYVAPLQSILLTRPVNIVYWFVGVPFTFFIFFVGEIRKLMIRTSPGGWVDRWTCW